MKATWTKGSTASDAARGVLPGLRSLEELRAAALEQLRAAAWLCLGMLEKRRKEAVAMEEAATGCPAGLPKG
jgi:hypothetical protein